MSDILDRLAHPEREEERRRPDRLFLLRNVLNAVFILIAVVAMVGIAVSWSNGSDRTWCYVLGLVAVGVKMVEVMLRMPTLLRRPQHRQQDSVRRLSEQMAAMQVKPHSGNTGVPPVTPSAVPAAHKEKPATQEASSSQPE